MTDAEIIKALNCCQTGCVGCPLIGNVKCRQFLCRLALDLIQRQQERLDMITEEVKKLIMQDDEYVEKLREREFWFALALVKGAQHDR